MATDAKRTAKTNVGKRRLTGVVVSHTAKTAIVRVARSVVHPLYKKAYRTHKKYHAHDAKDAVKVGDTVTIEAARPMGAHKRWRIV